MTSTTPHHHQATGARGCEHCSMGGFQTTYLHQGSASSFLQDFAGKSLRLQVSDVDPKACKERSTWKGIRRISMKDWIDFRKYFIDFVENQGLKSWPTNLSDQILRFLRLSRFFPKKIREYQLSLPFLADPNMRNWTGHIFYKDTPGIPRIPSASKDDPQQYWEMIKL